MLGFSGEHTDSVVSGNTVTSGLNLMSVGLMIGHHPWNASANVGDAGEVSGNTISGAVDVDRGNCRRTDHRQYPVESSGDCSDQGFHLHCNGHIEGLPVF